MAQTFGKFIEQQSGHGEYLKIGFYPTSIPLQQRWRNNGLSADFLADYLSTFFPGDDPASAERKKEIKDAVSYVANELLENAMKYSYASSQHRVSIEMFLESHAVSLYSINGVAPDGIEPFQRFIQRLLSEDLDKLYTEQLERSAADESGAASGLGFLTMLNDYKATMAWKFSSPAPNSDEVAVTTMVKLPV
ncbi:MAG: DUF6272 family protein [Betaproteobacteria bacterium]|nr:DUF6272 family protein [Betaproteobacteria bacterium]